MKIRNGFVSNSSSTSFTFVFNGEGYDDLYNMIKKYDQYFDLHYDYYNDTVYSCCADDIIKSIKDVADNITEEQKIKWDFIRIAPIEEEIDKAKENLEFSEESLREAYEKNKDDRDIKWLRYDADYFLERVRVLERAKSKGLNKVLEMDFGDNHGAVSGGNVGMAMDYEGRYIRINKDDFIVITTQNR